jgi:exopolysaccharide biosynthesis polyprenyl glycosylphosphotransferase
MNRKTELFALLVGDFIALNAAWMVYYWLRVDSGWFYTATPKFSDISWSGVPAAALTIYCFWMIAFAFFGLYRSWYVRAPFDEVITLLKTLSAGTVFLLIVFFWDPFFAVEVPTKNDPRLLSLIYWLLLVVFVIGIRSLIRLVQRRLLGSGIGRRPSIIIGPPDRAHDLAQRVAHYPRLGYGIIGYVAPASSLALVNSVPTFVVEHRKNRLTKKELPLLGTTQDLERIIDETGAKEVLIALGSNEHEALIDVIAMASKSNAGLKIEPGLYDIISGQARTREIYGFPLIDINPVLLRPWEEAAKRTLDIVVSATVLIIGLPIWLLVGVLVKLTSKGPIIYSQERIGKDGKPYRIYKFRSMRINAETSGPQWASKNDPRVTPLGRFLRRSHLDEVPQFWNVLKGDMSLVGPRPERDFFVRKLIEEIPYYNRRHKVRPGITGLYQAMIDKYDENLDDVRMRVKYDLMYIESMSFRLDVKILFRTAYMMLKARGQA